MATNSTRWRCPADSSRLRQLAGVIGLVLAACCSSPSEVPVEAKPLIAGEHSAIEVAGTEVLRSREEWLAWWSRHQAGGVAQNEPPEVDWSRDVAVAVTLGTRPTLGYGVELESARREGDVVHVLFRERTPDPGMLQGQVVTHPFLVVVLPRSEVRAELSAD